MPTEAAFAPPNVAKTAATLDQRSVVVPSAFALSDTGTSVVLTVIWSEAFVANPPTSALPAAFRQLIIVVDGNRIPPVAAALLPTIRPWALNTPAASIDPIVVSDESSQLVRFPV